ncbi:hypothetical protein NGG04_12840 [Mammaliicoccus sciuri]|uniref:hypothetical protein n=1 Tax=Mammaliicoccus sciuri TaxID=1296 RepID=UPI002DB7D767|nr:hypothetical protein [Mammaliicoccus sciuri]MEB7404979.1 hypothetical protein [Mammaliicoccus sciuri]MEB8312755.1 hypothetical protein [Mammaliicoccus sciuri]
MSSILNDLKAYKWYQMSWIHEYKELEDDYTRLLESLELITLEFDRWDKGDLFRKNNYVIVLQKKQELLLQKERVDTEIKLLKERMDNIFKVYNINNRLENKILILKHVEHKTLKEVSEILGYSESHIKNKHAEIRKMLNF